MAKASGAAVLACHHSGKAPPGAPAKTGAAAFRGASALLDGARFGMTLSDDGGNARTLRCAKSNYAKRWADVELTFDTTDKVFVLGSSGASAPRSTPANKQKKEEKPAPAAKKGDNTNGR